MIIKNLWPHTVEVTTGACLLLAMVLPVFSKVIAQDGMEHIRLNQVGYYTGASKIAVITAKTNDSRFYIISPDSRDTFYTGSLTTEKKSAYSSVVTRIAEFSSFKKPGNYIISVPGIGHSFSFRLNDKVYDAVAKAVLKGFYFQRSDMTLQEKYAGKWMRGAGHPDTIVLIHPSAASDKRPAGSIVSSPGGWYDAGDYNKYIVNSGITMGTLLSAYEDFPGYFNSLRTMIPESNDAIPDILNEVLYNLRWMLTMQDPADGGVYHKCTNAGFDGMVKPGVTQHPRYMVQKSTAAALDFAAVMAQAARIFKKFEKQLRGLPDSCLIAAKQAWKWSVKNPLVLYNQRQINVNHQPPVTTGEYGDRNVNDEWLWAAAELYATSGETTYYTTINERIKDPAQLPSWGNVAMLGYYTLIRMAEKLPSLPGKIVADMKQSIIGIADGYLIKANENAFKTVMGQSAKDFVWGSNAVAANQGCLLIYAYQITNDRKYLDGALSNLDYILGRNATGYSFITGAGSKSPMFPHHRPSEADDVVAPVPGLLVGGPNPGMQDKCQYPFTETETAYVDLTCSYASNEIAINWNAPAVYLINALCALSGVWNKQ
jgi:endoglucanase